jgi:DNA primase large subunit
MRFTHDPDHYVNLDDKEDTISFFLVCQSLALSPHSQKTFQAVRVLTQTIQKRLELSPEIAVMKELVNVEPADLSGEDQYRLRDLKKVPPEFMVNWHEVYEVTEPTREYIHRGKMYVTKYDLVKIYIELLRKKIHEYIESIADQIKKADHPLHKQIFNGIRFYSAPLEMTEELSSNRFPPCINTALSGVSAGTRNYAVTVLLTSFLSYARIFPSTRAFDRRFHLELREKEIGIILNGVIPMILEAGSRCEPPLFTDQPIEKQNVLYHLGFGLSSSPSVKDFGRSTWYLPPNCSKVRENAPSLCQPDAFCRKKFYQIADRERTSNLIKAAKKRKKRSLGEKILETLGKCDTVDELSEEINSPKGEIKKQLDILTKNGIVRYKGITNPLVYYIRRKDAS